MPLLETKQIWTSWLPGGLKGDKVTMRALVIGGNGFIGSHLVDRLVGAHWDIQVLDLQDRRYGKLPSNVRLIKGDMTHHYLVREALAGTDVVYLLAWAMIHEIANADPVADIQANLIPTIQVLEACCNTDVKRVVFISSGGTVYGPAMGVPIAETHPNSPISAYGITKLAVEKYLHMFRQLYGLDYVVLRPSVPYGPGQNPLGKQGAVAVFLYRTARGLPITIWGDGSATRDFFYVSDLITALEASATRSLDIHRVFNIGGNEEISLNRLLEITQELVGKKALVEYQPARLFDAQRVVLDTGLATRELGWRPQTPFLQGVAETWRWMSRTFR
jgi:UDP-glucose 4-epimerase